MDFRELIKLLANEFRARVEMRQISLRHEAGRLEGVGACGRELCCSTWITDFKTIPTSAARDQNLSLNPAKLSGQCGRLKCCLNYKLETYMDALSHIPKVHALLKTKKGSAFLQKTDIFRRIMYFSFEKDDNWYPVAAEKVKEILILNKKGEIPETLEFMVMPDVALAEETKEAGSLNTDLESLDRKYSEATTKKKKKKKKNRGKPRKPKAQ